MRSEKEIDMYISKSTSNNHIKEKLIKELKQKNYINDVEFTKRFTNDKINLSKDGLGKIKKDLINLGVEDSIIDSYLNTIDKNDIKERLIKLLDKYIRIHNKYSKYELENKALYYFINLGYEKELISELINNLDIETDPNIIKKEYNKLEIKYKKKYSKEELEKQVMLRLFQKGFTYEEIKKIKKQ